jgi:hypothetical protein
VIESTAAEWEQRERISSAVEPAAPVRPAYEPPKFRDTDRVMIRMRGLPYDVTPL